MKKKAIGLSLPITILAYIGLIVSDPATSPFHAIESALGTVGYSLIVPSMLFVIAVAVSVSLGYIAIGIRGEGGRGWGTRCWASNRQCSPPPAWWKTLCSPIRSPWPPPWRHWFRAATVLAWIWGVLGPG